MAKGKIKQKLAGVFARKEGGTMVGNLVRSVGDKFTGGMVSKILPPSTAEDVARQIERRGYAVKKQNPENTVATKAEIQAETLTSDKAGVEDVADEKKWYQKPMIIVGGVVGVIGLVWAVVKMFKKKK